MKKQKKILMTVFALVMIAGITGVITLPAQAAETTGSIVGVGSSSIQKCDMNRMFQRVGYSGSAKIYNMGKCGAKIKDLGNDESYINAVVEKQPRVIIIYGCNDMNASKKDNSKNNSVANDTYKSTTALIQKLHDRTLEATGIEPQIIYVSAFKTPGQYKASGSKAATCPFWTRIDKLNSKMRSYAGKTSYVTYVDVQPNLYCLNEKKWVRFYINDKNSVASGKDLVSGKKKCTFMQSDLTHLSRAGYDRVWKNVAVEAIKYLN